MFRPVHHQVNFPQEEEKIIAFWKEKAIFQQQITQRNDRENYVFYDGPPFATGLPHYGHLLASTIKDIVPRYFAMRGYRVERRFGWDCHGLPVEMEIQKELKLSTRSEIIKYGVERFNQACRDIVLRYTEEWEKTASRLGRWVDFKNDYKTMDLSFMESVWWVFKTLYDKGLIYRGFKVLPYSWKAGTVLANFEANLNYKSTSDPAVTVKFPLTDFNGHYFLAWTTTPWTLISNLALAIGPKISYVKLKNLEQQEYYYLSEKAASKLLKEKKPSYKIVEKISGKELLGRKYQPLFQYASNTLSTLELEKCFKILDGGDYVNEDEGVGVIHMAPAYGEEDYEIAQTEGLPHFDPIDDAGTFQATIDLVSGKNIKEADPLIIKHLKDRQLILKHENITHNYPFCWRTDSPLMYKAISTWFVKVESFRDQLNKNNQSIYWLPEHIKNGRFGQWLENARDWAISRNRFWGTPIPIWECDGDFICLGSVDDLNKMTGITADDIHKDRIDDLVIKKGGKEYRRVPEVLDCWFESGSMPYGQNHYPFENKAQFEANFPAHFISEGLDQTRGWFYTLLVIAGGLFGKIPFRNCIVSGLILAQDGKKMSKRLKNYPDPHYVLDRYGADALRVYLIHSGVIKAETLKFSEDGLREVMKSIMLPLWNSFSFLVNYANLDRWDPLKSSVPVRSNPMDRWIFSYLETLNQKISQAMDAYRLYEAVPPLLEFIDKLTNTYIRRSRRRFWRSESDQDKEEAYTTLYQVIKKFSIILAPFMPFLSERIYQVLRLEDDPISVHLEDYPTYQAQHIDGHLEREMESVDLMLNLGRSLRLKHHLKIRQPLSQMTIISQDPSIKDAWEKNQSIIEEELNIKQSFFSEDEDQYVMFHAKVDFKKLGRIYGKKINSINQKIMSLSSKEIALGIKQGKLNLEVEEEILTIKIDDLDLRREGKGDRVMINQGVITLVLDTHLGEELILEGMMRECVNRIQKQRKEMDLAYSDRVTIRYQGTEKIKQMIERFQNSISRETLAQAIQMINPDASTDKMIEDELNGESFFFSVHRV